MTMQKRKLNDQELDAIGKRLFAASPLTESEIDQIASVPGSFEGVLNRIRSNEAVSNERNDFVSFLFGHRAIVGTSFAAVLTVSAFAFFLKQGGPVYVSKHSPAGTQDVARPIFTPQVNFVKGFTSGRANFDPALSNDPTPVNAVQRETRRPQPRVEQASFSQNSNDAQFVAVTYTGDGGESARGGRVVRIDVPRSTLFAMGFDVPLENDSPTVKADLLIGPDGVTRAVRLVE
jgi:hypothetical protein